MTLVRPIKPIKSKLGFSPCKAQANYLQIRLLPAKQATEKLNKVKGTGFSPYIIPIISTRA